MVQTVETVAGGDDGMAGCQQVCSPCLTQDRLLSATLPTLGTYFPWLLTALRESGPSVACVPGAVCPKIGVPSEFFALSHQSPRAQKGLR